jgi:hypothetical protein
MTYSCSDLADDVMNNLVNVGLLQAQDIPDDSPERQASLVIKAIIGAADVVASKTAATQFFDELMLSVETLGGVCDEHGSSILANLMYLQNAILKGSLIELFPNEAEQLAFVRALPSGERWWKHVSPLPANG